MKNFIVLAILTTCCTPGWTYPSQCVGKEKSTPGSRTASDVYTGMVSRGEARFGWGGKLGDIIAGDLGYDPVAFALDLTGYTSSLDVQRCGQILETQGQKGLLRSLSNKKLGYFRLNGQPERQVIFAQQSEDESGRRITVLCQRWLNSFIEGYEHKTGAFPFAYIELSVDKSGKTDGVMYMAASVRSGKRPGSIVGVEDYANEADLLKDIRRTTGSSGFNAEARPSLGSK
jgi:hypothetical protein